MHSYRRQKAQTAGTEQMTIQHTKIFTLRPLALLLVAMLPGCQAISGRLWPSTTLDMILPPLEERTVSARPESDLLQEARAKEASRQTSIEKLPATPTPTRTSTIKAASITPATEEKANITLMFDQLPLPNFIHAVYGVLLKKNYQVDPAIAAKKDLVTIRAAQPQTPSQIDAAARMLLKSYGIAVLDLGGGFYRIMPDSAQTGFLPEIKRGRAMPEVPLPMRPVFQMVELTSVRPGDVGNWLRTMFGQRVTVQEDLPRNAIMLSGQSDAITAALEAIQVLDQPNMKGRQSIRLTPAFWSADEFVKRLAEVLQVEGYNAGIGAAGAQFPIAFIPISAINTVLVFAADTTVLNHVIEWAKSLDRPNRGNSGGYFTYNARFTDAKLLAQTMENILSGQQQLATAAASGSASSSSSGSTAQAASTRPKSTRVVVNAATNTLIFQGGADEYTQILGLLQELDRPAKSALIEVTVAEVTLDDSTQLGVEWAFKMANLNLNGKGKTVQGGTLGGLGIGSSGLTITALDSVGDTNLIINALASNNRASVLSSPRIMARNGEFASIQVGQEVPVLTSSQSTTTGGVLQTVQYRSTGVILKVKPVIHSGDRIELEVYQEVSSAASTSTGVTTSPTISQRKVETRLTLRDGSTILLGGLIGGSTSAGDSGIPLLKDIPLLGQFFRTNSDGRKKTELLILITPYVINDDTEAEAITSAFRNQVGNWAHDLGTANQTVRTKAAATSVPATAATRDLLPTTPPVENAPPAPPPETSPPADTPSAIKPSATAVESGIEWQAPVTSPAALQPAEQPAPTAEGTKPSAADETKKNEQIRRELELFLKKTK